MFEICSSDIRDFTVKSVKLFEDPSVPLMALMSDFVLVHKHLPTVEIFACGGLQINGSFVWEIAPKDHQDIISIDAQREIHNALIDIMDDLMDFCFRAHIKLY